MCMFVQDVQESDLSPITGSGLLQNHNSIHDSYALLSDGYNCHPLAGDCASLPAFSVVSSLLPARFVQHTYG